MTNILVKLFARGFYKVHSGFLVFVFVMLVSYCFFINTLGDVKLLPKGKEFYYHFIILINFVSNPAITIGFFMAWLIYTIKSWSFVSGQLLPEHHQFLFYSVNAFGKIKQFKSWFYTQFIISLPFVVYTLLAGIAGILLHYYVMVAFILFFTFLLIAISAALYTKLVNDLVHEKRTSWLFRLSRYWRKPFYSLFIYHVFDKLKVTWVLSKLLSYVIIISVFFALAGSRNDPRVAGLVILGIVMAHAVLIYQQHRFQLTYLSISRNLPYSMGRFYREYAVTYLVLLLPECTWLFVNFKLPVAAGLLLLCLAISMLFHCLLYRIGADMNKYLPRIFALFFIISFVILYGYLWMLVPLCFGVSFILFYFNYYEAELDR